MKTTYNYATHKNEVWYSEEEIKPFLDPYFKGLDFKTIAELAKKSIRITADNCGLEHKLEDIADLYDDSEYAKQVKKIIQRESFYFSGF